MAAEKNQVGDPPSAKRCKTSDRKFSKLPVWICENHDEVLYYIHRAIASRHLPFKGITLLHFDSHPDLTIPVDLPADVVYDKEALYDKISIADWILPAVYAGHINCVIWMKPYWADQMPDGIYSFKVGRHKQCGFLRVTCMEDYFLEELLYAAEEELENTQELRLIISTVLSEDCKRINPKVEAREWALKSNSENCEEGKDYPDSRNTEATENATYPVVTGSLLKPGSEARTFDYADCQTQLSEDRFDVKLGFIEQKNKTLKADSYQRTEGKPKILSTKEKSRTELVKKLLSSGIPYILDIDMDFFSTRNPFKDLFTEAEFECLCDLYQFTKAASPSDQDIVACLERRGKQIEELDSTLFHQHKKESSQGNDQELEKGNKAVLNEQLIALTERMKDRKKEPLDYQLIHFAGMTIDLPYHVSSTETINQLLDALTDFLATIPQPTLVTMARSAHDEYTPSDQVEQIQSSLVDIIQKSYGGTDYVVVHQKYGDEC